MRTENELRTIEKIEHRDIRWIAFIYDAVIYFLTWLLLFALAVIFNIAPSFISVSVNVLIGFLFIFFARFISRSYKKVIRFGTLRSFALDFLAVMIGGVIFVIADVLLWSFAKEISIFPLFAVIFVLLYAVVSMGARFSFCYLYRFAQGSTKGAYFVRRAFEVLAHVDFSSSGITARKLVFESATGVRESINELQFIIDKFAIRGEVTSITQINKGYINRTYKVETLSQNNHVHKYTLQRINTNVFPDADKLMKNFKLTTENLRGKQMLLGQRSTGPVQTLRTTKDGCSYLLDGSGCWRMLTYLDDVYSLDIPDKPETFYYAGKSFGAFLREMSNIDASEVEEVIPNFHNTKSRYNDLEEAIKRDAKGRVKDVGPEIEFIRARKDKYGIISDALESGKIPTRVCHNDCNLNNILFDSKTGYPVAIIDLDTVMPSSPLYDYGDSMRIGTNKAKDDEKDLSKVSCDLDLYERYARGYLEACGDILTKEELRLLPYASIIITAEDGIRFLMDHINGDTYYTIYYPGQNLDRARTQLRLVLDMENKLPKIKNILSKIYKDLGLSAELD
jgi:hypothetical protein